MKYRAHYIIPVFLSVFLMCCTCATDNNTTKEIDPTLQTSIRVINVSLGSGSLHLLQNDRSAIKQIQYAVLPMSYVSIPSGVRNLRLLNSSDKAVFSINANLSPNPNYSLFLIDTVIRMSGILLQDIPSLLPKGEIIVRLVHGGMNTGNAELYVGSSASGSPIVSGVGFRSFSSYVQVPFGSSLTLRINGTKGIKDFAVPASSFADGAAHTIILYGDENSTAEPLAYKVIQ